MNQSYFDLPRHNQVCIYWKRNIEVSFFCRFPFSVYTDLISPGEVHFFIEFFKTFLHINIIFLLHVCSSKSSWSEKPEFLRAANQVKIGKKDLIWGAPYKNISNFTNINTDRRKKVNSTFERSMQQVSIVLFIFFWNFLNQKLHLILQWKIVKNRDFFDDFQEKNHDFCDKKVM